MENINYISLVISIFSIMIAIISIYYTIKTKKRYEKIAMRLGKGEDITNILKNYISQVNELNEKDNQIIDYCNKINLEESKSIKKIGLVKYDLYNTTKNKLSFALVLLNRQNSGIIINSIYGVDNSNVYCKEVIEGKTKDKLSLEEKEALKIAMSK